MNKLDTNRNYGSAETADDILRAQCNGRNYEETIKILHRVIEYFFKDPHRQFIKNESLPWEGLIIKDKGILSTTETNYQKILHSLPPGEAK